MPLSFNLEPICTGRRGDSNTCFKLDAKLAGTSSASPQYPSNSTNSLYHHYPLITVRLGAASQKLPIPRHGAFCVKRHLRRIQSRIYIQRLCTHTSKVNLQRAINHPEVVEQYLHTELNLGRLVGPFCPSLTPTVHISRFGIIPKNHQESKWRLIVDLSFPSGHSVNDGIPKELCSLKYITIDDAISYIVRMGQGTDLAKIDIKSAFRQLPVHAADWHLLGMQWKGAVFIDTCLPFGLRSAPKLFNTIADLLAWIMRQHWVQPLLHYLDDFLTVGPPNSNICQQNLDTIKQVCDILRVPLALKKVEGPATSLSFLGITLDGG